MELPEFYENLISAIIDRAMMDYVEMMIGILEETTTCNCKECERFFNGPLFSMMSDIDGPALIQKCKQAAERVKLEYAVSGKSGKWYVHKLDDTQPIGPYYKTKFAAMERAATLNGLNGKLYAKLLYAERNGARKE